MKHFIGEADAAGAANLWGTALYHLKEAWWLKYWDAQKEGKQKQLKERMVLAYEKLGKRLLAETMNTAFKWIE